VSVKARNYGDVCRLTGRKTEVPTSRHQDRRSYSYVESPVTPIVARLKPFRVDTVWHTADSSCYF